jgi:hypothetical protein
VTEKQRYQRAILAISISLLISYCAVAFVFRWPGFSSIARNPSFLVELAFDIIGLTGCGFALLASYLLYPIRRQLRAGIVFTGILLIAVLLAFEFGVGIVWLTADKVIRYEQRAK